MTPGSRWRRSAETGAVSAMPHLAGDRRHLIVNLHASATRLAPAHQERIIGRARWAVVRCQGRVSLHEAEDKNSHGRGGVLKERAHLGGVELFPAGDGGGAFHEQVLQVELWRHGTRRC
jgi:hypothetical protein